MLTFKFNLPKTIQASAALLRQHGDRMDRMRLLRLLYIADRELLAETGRTLTGDRVDAMEKGPVLRTVYDLIKGQGADAGAWQAVVPSDGSQVALAQATGFGNLTKAELSKAEELCERYRDTDTEDLSKLTHGFAEWIDNYKPDRPPASYPITWDEVLVAQNAGDLIDEVEADIRDRELVDAAFGG